MLQKGSGIYLIILLGVTVVFTGCSGITTPDKAAHRDEPEMENTTVEKERKQYLEQQLMSPQFGGTVYCAYEQADEEWEGNQGKWYGWVFCLEFLEDGSEGAGVSLPVVLDLERTEKEVKVTGHAVPEDGSDYEQSMRRLFPKQVREQLSQLQGDVDHLEQEVKQQWKKQD